MDLFRPFSKRLLGGAALLTSALMAGQVSAATFSVNNDTDGFDNNPGDGICWTGLWVPAGPVFSVRECTLRAAIQETNALAGADEIHFSSLAPQDAWGNIVIRPNSAFPAISGTLKIDGTQAPGYDAGNPTENPVVVLDGVNSGAGHGLWFGEPADWSEVHALAIIRFVADGIYVGGADFMTIQANHIGLNRGYTPLGNGGDGIQVSTGAFGTTIGQRFDLSEGYTGRGNVICGNDGNGIYVGGSGTEIADNHIGTDRVGNTVGSLFGDYSNHGWGVRIYSSPSNVNVGRSEKLTGGPWLDSGNVISGNDDGGVLVDDTPTFVSILSNHIGIGANGTTHLGNGTRSGIDIRVDGVNVGDEGHGGNIISGNDRYGIEVSVASDWIRVVGNIIGLDASETVPVPNDLEAVLSIGGANHTYAHNTIGGNGDDGLYINGDDMLVEGNFLGTNGGGDDLGNGGYGVVVNGERNIVGSPAHPNVIGFNTHGGVKLDFSNDSGAIQANFIGVGAAGEDIGNQGPGIQMWGPDNVVGGALAGQGNTIGNNAGHGIESFPGATNTRIMGNLIGTDGALADHGNQGAGIYLPNAFGSEVGADETTADGDVVAHRNMIGWNTGDGVRVTDAGSGIRNAVRGNYFHENGEQPIDLANDGANANDFGDFDGGANSMQNSPVLDGGGTAYDWPSSLLDVRYTITSQVGPAAYPIKVDFHLVGSDGVSPGEWIGSDIYQASDAMNARGATIAPIVPMLGNERIMAIATDAAGNTSEMGNLVSVPEPGFGAAAMAGGFVLASLARRRGARGRD